jgi:hypothetical protein
LRVIDDEVHDSGSLTRLRRTLEALSDIGPEQPALFPEFEAGPAALSLEFNQSAALLQEQYADALSSGQHDALAALDRKLLTISRDGAEFDADLWTDEALATSAHWADVRQLAKAALGAFGWD